MSAKKIIFDHEALETIKLGVKQLADAVRLRWDREDATLLFKRALAHQP